MSDARFNIVFSGELVAGADPAKVRENLAKVFKMDLAKVEALFSGKPVVIKKSADQATAMKFRAVLRQAGAQCEMVPLEQPDDASAPASPAQPEPESAAPAAAAAPDAPGGENRASAEPAPGNAAVQAPQAPQPAALDSASAAARADMETVGTIRTGGTGFTPEFNVAPVGADMADQTEGPPPVAPDISHLSMAPPGTDLEQLPDQRQAVNPDISHLTLAEESSDKS